MTSPPIQTRPDWGAAAFPAEVANQIASAIVAGSPFANSLSRDPTGQGGARAYPRVLSVSGQAWVAEGAPIPDINMTTDTYIVASQKLAGIVLLSREQVEDAGPWSPQSETARVVQDAFSHDLDQGLIHGDGVPPNPTGVLGVAAAADGPDLVGSVAAALASIGEAGGTASHVAMSPTTYATASAEMGSDGHPVYPNGLTLFNLTLVQCPGLTQSLVYDSTEVRLLVSRDFRVDASTDYADAFRTDSIALRISGRFNVAIPVPGKAVRKLTVTAPGGAEASETRRTSARAK